MLVETEKFKQEHLLTSNEGLDAKRYCEAAPDYMVKGFSDAEWCTSCYLGVEAAIPIWKSANVRLPDEKEIEYMVRWFVAQKPLLNPEDPNTWLTAMVGIASVNLRTYTPPAEEVVPVPPPGKFDSGRAEIESLLAEALKHKYGSRDRESLQRKAYQLELTIETVGGQYAEVLQEIVDQSGLSLSTANNFKFQNFLQSPVAKRRFTNSREDVRMAFAEYFGCDTFLSEDERAKIAYRRGVEGMTSDDIKRQVGSRNTYDPANSTYRANPTGRV